MQKIYSFSLEGGLDLVTPALALPPGRVIGCVNYEPDDEGGYRRVAGYERYSGLPSPTEADYWLTNFDAGDIEPTVGDIITGATSGETGELLAYVVETGDWATNDATGYFITFNNTGVFTDDENLQVAAVTQAVANGNSSRNGSTDETLNETYTRAAREARRADIQALPGSGNVRGVWMYQDKVYAFRDNVGATAGIMYEDSATGWQTVDLGERVQFTAGTAAFLEGETLTDGTASATIVAVGVDSGSWSGNDAAGYVYIKNRSGGSFSATTITSASGSATGSGAEAAVTLPAGGKYEFQSYNFGGQLSTRYMYGCNGVGNAFRFDGTDFAFIHVTGATTDAPRHLKAHKNHLFLTIGSSALFSSIGDPMVWDAITGAGEIATGDTIVGLDTQPGGVLGIFNRNSTYILYGNDAVDFTLTEHSIERGAIEYSLQNVMVPLYLDDRGIMYLNPAQEFGDFKAQSISEIVDPFIQLQKDKVLSSARIKDKNQYRLFYDDNSFLIARVSASFQIQYMIGNYGKEVHCICAEENENGVEEVYFGSTDGYIYRAEKGESFDGEVIEYFLRTPFWDLKSPRQKKRFHKITYLLDATEPPDLNFLPEYSYGTSYLPASTTQNVLAGDIQTGGGYWGDANWGEFLWDGQVVGEADAYITGTGINMSLYIRGESNYEQQHTLQAATIHYTPRGLKR